MKESFEPQEYRDELAEKLKDIRGSDKENPELAKAKAQGYLEAKKETEEYEIAKKHGIYNHELPQVTKIYKEGESRRLEELNSQLEQLKSDPVVGFIFKGMKFVSDSKIRARPDKSKIYHPTPAFDFDLINPHVYSGEDTEALGAIELLLKNQHLIPESFRNLTAAIDSSSQFVLYKSGYSMEGIKWNDSNKRWEQGEWSSSWGLSSLRFKDEIAPLINTIDKIKNLRGVSFKWKNKNSPREIGVIAEEVYAEFPELVALDDEGKPLGVYYDKFVGVLIESIKELNKRITSLEKK